MGTFVTITMVDGEVQKVYLPYRATTADAENLLFDTMASEAVELGYDVSNIFLEWID